LFYAASTLQLGKWLLLRDCPHCGSHFFDPLKLGRYEVVDTPKTVHYIEVGAGISTIAELLSQLPAQGDATFLEIGSGYGYSLDIWEKEIGAYALGIEPSARGSQGADELGVRVHSAYLHPRTVLPGSVQQFDVVASMEVIEHVKNPRDFIRIAADFLKPDGVLLLTTPDASWVSAQEKSSAELYGALSPGYHTFLLSHQALIGILEEEGFSCIETRSSERQIKLFASRRPLQLKAPDRRVTISYLQKLLDRSPVGSAVHRGAAYRLFEQEMNAGHFQEAETVHSRLEQSLETAFGAEILQPDERLKRVLSVRNLNEFTDQLPTFICDYEFLLGLREMLIRKAPMKASARFDFATEMTAHLTSLVSLSGVIFPAPWRFQFENGQAHLHAGDTETGTGLAIWETMTCKHPPDDSDQIIPMEWRQRACMARLRYFVSQGDWALARPEWDRFNTLLEEAGFRPENSAMVVAALKKSGVSGAGIEAPLWYLFCGASIFMNAVGTHLEACKWFENLSEACETLASDPVSNCVAADLYRNARFHQALAAEFMSDSDRAREGYRWLIENTEPVIGPGEQVDVWADRALQQLR
jgi:SAM-dependent methyltransferase